MRNTLWEEILADTLKRYTSMEKLLNRQSFFKSAKKAYHLGHLFCQFSYTFLALKTTIGGRKRPSALPQNITEKLFLECSETISTRRIPPSTIT